MLLTTEKGVKTQAGKGNLKNDPGRSSMLNKIPRHLFAVLMLGMVSQIGQVLLLRELLMVFHGNELSIGIILSAWLLWVGVGSRLGAHLLERVDRPVFLLAFSALGVLFAFPATILCIRSLRSFFHVLPGAYLSLWEMAVSSFLLMAPVCFLLGTQFVFLSRLWRMEDKGEDTSGAGKTYVGEAAGSMMGGIFFTFILVHFLNSFQSAALVALTMLFTILMISHRGQLKKRKITALASLTLVTLGAGGFFFLERLDGWAHELLWRHFSPHHELVGIYPSKHGNIAVLQREDQFSFFQSGHLIFSTAGPETTIPGLEEQEAVTFAHFSMVQHKYPEQVLLIGGGLRGMLGEIAKHPVLRVDYLELDEVLTEAARPFVTPRTFEALEDPRISLIHTDARLFVKETKNKYDMIIVDAPDPATAVLNRHYTLEFFREARSRLNPGGVLVLGATSTPDLRGTAVANRNATLYHTLSSVFAHVYAAGERFLFYFASDDPHQISLDVATLRARYRERQIEAEGFSELHYHVLLQDQQLRRVNWILTNHGRTSDAHLKGPGAPPISPGPLKAQREWAQALPPVDSRYFINSDFKPIGYFYTLMFWDQLTRDRQRDTLKGLLHIQPWWLVPLMLIPLTLVLVLGHPSIRPGQRTGVSFAVLFTVFTTGLSTMTMQVALLFSFQSIYGFIYEMVGLIVALFMFGLALGAFFTQRHVADKTNLRTLALVQLLMALLACLMAFILPWAGAIPSAAVVLTLFSTLTFAAGLINGMDFPLATACSMAQTGKAEQSAGKIYGMELMGACVGAAAASAVVAPVLGIAACFYLAAAANGTAFLTLLISRSSHV